VSETRCKWYWTISEKRNAKADKETSFLPELIGWSTSGSIEGGAISINNNVEYAKVLFSFGNLMKSKLFFS
jgi:hypothetical protein